jgi:hypothetical protein
MKLYVSLFGLSPYIYIYIYICTNTYAFVHIYTYPYVRNFAQHVLLLLWLFFLHTFIFLVPAFALTCNDMKCLYAYVCLLHADEFRAVDSHKLVYHYNVFPNGAYMSKSVSSALTCMFSLIYAGGFRTFDSHEPLPPLQGVPQSALCLRYSQHGLPGIDTLCMYSVYLYTNVVFPKECCVLDINIRIYTWRKQGSVQTGFRANTVPCKHGSVQTRFCANTVPCKHGSVQTRFRALDLTITVSCTRICGLCT